MSTTQVLRSRFPRAFGAGTGLVTAPARGLDSVGHVAWFVVSAFGSIGHALRYYRKETLRLIAEIGMGTGAMAVIGGTVAIVGFVTLSGSSLVAIQGFASLRPWWRGWLWLPLSVRAPPPNWAPCASARRSTHSR